jgi:hypothetical protein
MSDLWLTTSPTCGTKIMNKKTISIVICAIIVVGAVSFYAGSSFYKNKQPVRDQNFMVNGNNFAGRGGNIRGGNNFTGGKVISKDDKSITVQARDGSSKIIFFTANTPVMKMVAGVSGDISVGQDLTIAGTANPDGSISAESIQIRQTVANTTQK